MTGQASSTSTPEPTASFGAWAIVFILMLTMVFSLVDRFAISLLVEPIKADLGLSDRDIGLLSGIAFGIFYACMGLPMGVLADRWSPKGTIVVGVGIWSLATAACGLATSFAQLLAARIGVGAGEAGLAPASFSIISRLFPRAKLGKAMSLFQLGATLGSGLALWLVGLIFASFESGAGASLITGTGLAPWQATFITVALPGLPFVLLISMLQIGGRVRNDEEAPPLGLLAALRMAPRFYACLFAAMSGVLLVNYALLSWVPAFIQREFGVSPKEIGAAYGTILFMVCPIAMLGGGWLADRLDDRGVTGAHALIVLVAVALTLVFTLLLYAASTLAATYVAIALLHFAVTLPVGVAPALIQLQTLPAVRARVSALYVLVVNLAGLGIGPVVVGAISDILKDDPSGLRHSVSLVSLVVISVSLPIAVLLVRHIRSRGS